MPATSATMPATDQTMIQIFFSGIPTASAAWWSSATARKARPVGVYWKKNASPATSSAQASAAIRSKLLTSMPAMSSGTSGTPMSSFLTFEPHNVSPNPSRKKVSPIVDMNRMMSGWLMRCRSTRSSTR